MHRVEVRPTADAGDPRADALLRDAARLGFAPAGARSARVYLIRGPLTDAHADRLARELLASPVVERFTIGVEPVAPGEHAADVLPLPGVMDPAAQTVARAAADLLGLPAGALDAKTGVRYDLAGVSADQLRDIARRLLANPVVDDLHLEPWLPDDFPAAPPADQTLRTVPITHLDDAGLAALSRDGHLFLSPDEMRAVRDHYRDRRREPTDIELETIAQTWSEHCVHKTLKSTVSYSADTPAHGAPDPIDWSDRPGVDLAPDGSVTIHNLLRSTVAAATHELIDAGLDWTLSVFVDNAGVVAFTDDHAVNIKVETHNHPSALEPYGGAATGVGGVIRDVIATGLGAKPVANTDVFCVAPPDLQDLPPGCLHPRRILTRVVDGVRDYGNRMGIPTLNGAVAFDPRYVGNPLVFCGSVGVMPRGDNDSMIRGAAKPGDRVVALGGRTGRDGIHGATFSSAELTHTHADEFSHAVQIGNAIEEKRLLDALLRARDHRRGPLYHAVTDCGAGGFSSAVGEMGEQVGAEVHLDRAPLKYDGLRYDEVWISESQERLVLAVPEDRLDDLRAVCAEEHVELADLGTFGAVNEAGLPELRLFFRGEPVGRLDMHFLHDGVPMPTRTARWSPEPIPADRAVHAGSEPRELAPTLARLLAHPDIASKRWIIRQYDHEVQGATLAKPLVGPLGVGPGDAAAIAPVPDADKALAIASGLATPVGEPARGGDPYLMALAAIDECVRNLVCIGADPERAAILDNFCWPSCNDPNHMAALVRACAGCYDAATAYQTPFVSGKDSLHNQFTYTDPATNERRTIAIPHTLLITGIAPVDDPGARLRSSDLKPVDGSAVLLVGDPSGSLAASHASMLEQLGEERVEPWSPDACAATARAVARLIAEGAGGAQVLAAHDCSEGGPLAALAEMLLAADDLDARADLGPVIGSIGGAADGGSAFRAAFAERPGRYLLQVRDAAAARAALAGIAPTLEAVQLATVHRAAAAQPTLTIQPTGETVPVADLRDAFHRPLDW